MDKRLLERLREVLKGLEELERLGCRVDANLCLEIKLPEVAENRSPFSSRMDVLRILATALDYEYAEELLKLLKPVSHRRIVAALLNLGRATAMQLLKHTGLPEASLYRALDRLRSHGLIEVVGVVPNEERAARGGPRPKIYALKVESHEPHSSA